MAAPKQQGHYGDNGRGDVAPFIPRGASNALEIGCGRGGFGQSLRKALGPAARIVGVEAVPQQAAIARQDHGFDEVVTGYFPDCFKDRTDMFDLICFNDVIEHVVEPDELLAAVKTRLLPGGQVLAAIPSIQYAVVVWRLIRGRWDYVDIGTLDRTHLRFFTRATMVELFERHGFTVEECRGANSVARHWESSRVPVRLGAKLGARLLGDAQWVHFIVLARLPLS